MLKERQRLVNGAHRIIEAGLVIASVPAAHALRDVVAPQYALEPLFPLSEYRVLIWVAAAAWVLTLHAFGLYRSFRTRRIGSELWTLGKAAGIATLFIFAGIAILRQPHISRLVVGLSVAIAAVSLAGLRIILRIGLHVARRRGYNYRSLIIVGTGSRARALARGALRNSHWGIRPVGFVATSPTTRLASVCGVPVVGHIDELEQVLTYRPVDEVIIAVPPRTLFRLQEALLICGELGIRTQIAMNFAPRSLRRFMIDDFGGVPTLSIMGPTPGEVRAFARRTFDVVGSAIALLLAAPVMAAAALAIRIRDGKPILFRQTRVGLKGRLFTLYKFRTMVPEAEAMKKELLDRNEMTGPVFKMTDDPRVTPLGSFLRRTSLDELPQLWNVLRGDMSLVGPRPPVPEEVERYSREQRRRLAIRPGLTGLWQVSGRNEITDFDEWMRLDLQYVDSANFAQDFEILLKTIPAVFRGRGAR